MGGAAVLHVFHFIIADTSNVSIGDLENIQETDTPPQSPTDSQPSCTDAITISMNAPPTTTTVHYKKRTDTEKGDDTDVDSLSPHSSKFTTSPAKVIEQICENLLKWSMFWWTSSITVVEAFPTEVMVVTAQIMISNIYILSHLRPPPRHNWLISNARIYVI